MAPTMTRFEGMPSQEQRVSAVEQALAAGKAGQTYHVPLRERYLEVPVVELAHDTLVYRFDNGRLLSELAAHAEDAGTTASDLAAHKYEGAVQATLHGLLLDKARDREGPIYQELERHARQTEPLLIERDGTVLNGNRRLAAMRELVCHDPVRYADFSRVRVAVLPGDLDAEQREHIEAALQMAPDLKLAYSWINRRLKLREHVADMGRDATMTAYRFNLREEIEAELAELALAEAYLEWSGHRRRYGRVISHGDAFALLSGQLAKLDPAVHAPWQTVGFAMIATEDRLDRPLAHIFPFADPVPPAARIWVPYALAEEHGLAEPQNPGENRVLTKDQATALARALADPDAAEAVARATIALQDRLKGDQAHLLGAFQVLIQLRTARRTLETIEPGTLSTRQLQQIRAEIAALGAFREGAVASGRPGNRRGGRLRQAWRALVHPAAH